MPTIKPSELWVTFCERNGLDAKDTKLREFGKFKELFSNMTPHFTGSAEMDIKECWVWEGRFNNRGYPVIGLKMAHREAFFYFRAALKPQNKVIRLCGNIACVNPYHLRQVAAAVALGRSQLAPVNRKFCPAGHPYDAKNTYTDPANRRRCRACGRIWVKRRAERLKQEKLDHKDHKKGGNKG